MSYAKNVSLVEASLLQLGQGSCHPGKF